MSLYSEILEQPECLRGLLATQKKTVYEIAERIKRSGSRFVLVAARGTSENAGRYAKYLWGAMNRMPVALAAPSLFTYYNQPPQLQGAFVVGISQSGQSPDIVSVLAEGKRQGCLTLAITNEVHSPLANAVDFVLSIEAGSENAVAATKTYTSELMAIAMLSAAISGDEAQWKTLLTVPDGMMNAFNAFADYESVVQRYRSITKCLVLGRGFNFATAHEWALKLKELAYVEAQPYSTADFLHGPIAAIDGAFPVLAVVPTGAVSTSVVEVLRKLRSDYQADLVVISDIQEALDLGETVARLPQGIPEWLSPIVAIVPAQLFCYHLARTRGCNTESSRGIRKVTETR